jgi:hypothetical protein
LWAEFNDSYRVDTFSLPVLALLYQATYDDTLPAAVAKVLGISVEEVLKKFKPDFTPSQSELF